MLLTTCCFGSLEFVSLLFVLLTRWNFGTMRVHSKKSPVQVDDLDVVDEILRTPYIFYMNEVIIYLWESLFLKTNIKEI
ncbi:hypothetical protein HanXRQr2_Chr05g0224641 [Helianthus annuus]|uniref:Uncharacterized protein n=1 Tax=Helianthus annuus TaxID=4232 RepID=A0A9K3J0U2_HELAN|nr:hypothetical protein HanXRQr2_Chr05g0224641 [Helianthus annuus]